MLALLGLGVVVAGAGVVVFAATWLWAPGTVALTVLAIVVEEAVDGDIVVDGVAIGVGIGVVAVVVAGASVEGGVEVVGSALMGASVVGPVTFDSPPGDATPVTPASWCESAAAGAAAVTVVPSPSWARTTPE